MNHPHRIRRVIPGVLLICSQALSQSVDSAANFGSLELQGNFDPDPYTVPLALGGFVDASGLGDACVGYISDAPDFELNYSNGVGYDLSFFVVSDIDATLVVNDPSGTWHCNDDFSSEGGTNPGLVFTDPLEGTYDIWVGSYSEGDAFAQGELVITELAPPWSLSDPIADEGVTAGEPTVNSSGSGFLVSREGHVLTNYHVIEGCAAVTFQIRGEIAVTAQVLATNPGTDLALLKTPLTHAPALFRGATTVRLGDEVVVYGFPLMGDLSSQGNLTNGIVSALSGLSDDLSRMQITAPIQPGNSGGPVFDRSGLVVGVVVETANDQYFREQRGAVVQNLNFAIHDFIARAFLDTNNVRYESGAGGVNTLSIADIAQSAQGFTGQIVCYR